MKVLYGDVLVLRPSDDTSESLGIRMTILKLWWVFQDLLDCAHLTSIMILRKQEPIMSLGVVTSVQTPSSRGTAVTLTVKSLPPPRDK